MTSLIPSYCPTCGHAIIFLRTKKDKLIPVDADTVKSSHTRYDKTLGHRAHFATCRKAQQQKSNRQLA